MNPELLTILRCPVTRSTLRLEVIEKAGNGSIQKGILYAEQDWFYPIIDQVPRLLVEAFLDHSDFFQQHMPQYADKAKRLQQVHSDLINLVIKKKQAHKSKLLARMENI